MRGTAQHVAEKYLQLARDAHTGNDPVAAENYLQHAEHYFRLIAAAQAVHSGPQKGDVQAPATRDSQGIDDSDDFGGLPDRFAPREQETQPILTNPTNVLLPTALQRHGQRAALGST